MTDNTQKYLFGDTDFAAQRLEVLAGAFEASSRAFISQAVESRPQFAIDLGCGPGYTTHMLAEATRCARAIGLDNSEHFIRLAERSATDAVSFCLHDVTQVPFPAGPSDIIYARFLLTHQAEPESLIARWAGQLRPGGRLLLEETDAIYTSLPAFAEYIRTVEKMLTAAGSNLYVGGRLSAMPAPPGLKRPVNKVARLAVPNDLAATMFAMNIQTWKHNEFVRNNYQPEAIRLLEEKLNQLAATPTNETGIEWRLRQLVYEREK